MKRERRLLFRSLAALLAGIAAFVVISRIAFDYDVFDRSGWRADEDGSLRYCDYYGRPLTGWQQLGEETYYFYPERRGAMATGWVETDVGRCYFAPDGRLHTGWLSLPEGSYYLQENGAAAAGWVETPEGTFYLEETGLAYTGWLEKEDGPCYLEDGGLITKKWVDTPEGRYYLNESGVLHTGWLQWQEETYYCTETGVMHTGWLELDDARYYFYPDGTMAVGEVEIDGEKYHFNSRGQYFILVNPWNYVPDGYEPQLVPFMNYQVDATCVDALAAMIDACEDAGNQCKISSAYRSFDYQTELFERKVNRLMAAGYSRAAAEAETGLSIAIPGTSEHQLGLAIDLKNSGNTYQWLEDHSWEYGFIQRYPYGKTSITGIYYEPWHVRYVGKEMAAELYEIGFCLEEYVQYLTEME